MDDGPMMWVIKNLHRKDEECFTWPFLPGTKGYPRVSVDRKMRNVSRIMCFMLHGEPPSEEHQASHSCGNGARGCVNPAHISWKTPTENQADRLIHGTLFPNKPKNNTSGVPGVGFHKATNRWRAYISESNKQKSLGFYDTMQEAIEARTAGLKARIGERE